MRILIVGGGGREHAITWSLAQNPGVSRLFCAPGNAGIAQLAERVPLQATDLAGLVSFARNNQIDRVFVAPDDPLALGLVDALAEAGITAYGPSRQAARIEASKAYAKNLMRRKHIPTADFAVFDDLAAARSFVAEADFPLVVKADGLALGKGVLICQDRQAADQALEALMSQARFGAAGRTVVLERFLSGPELTVMAFTDGRTVVPMRPAQDHKRAFDGDQGPNTGGMGAVCPGLDLDDTLLDTLQTTIFQPTVDALAEEGHPFKGVLYFGLMLTQAGPRVIEYNARFGDPEAQAVLPLLETDLLAILEAVDQERLDQLSIRWKKQASCCVVLASGGYPDAYETGFPISGLDQLPAGCLAFHAGTAEEKGDWLTAGGRVLGLTALAPTQDEAISRAYQAVNRVYFKHMHYRKDIGRS